MFYFKYFRIISKIAYKLRHFRPSAFPHVSWRLPLDGFPRNLKTGNLYKSLSENSFFFKSDKKSGSLHEAETRCTVAGDINSPRRHCCATISIFFYF